MNSIRRFCLVCLLLGFCITIPAWSQAVFFDDFTVADGTSLDGRVLPGGSWTAVLGSAVVFDNHARILDQIDNPDLLPMPGRIRLTLDTPVTTGHRFQITAVDYIPGAKELDIRSEETPGGIG